MKINNYSEFPILPAHNRSRSKRKAIYGIANNDANYIVAPSINGKQIRCPINLIWMQMLTDCYAPNNKSKRSFHNQRIICNEWKSFNNFRKWVLNHKEDEWFGKRLKVKGTVYSPECCYFKNSQMPKINNNIPTKQKEVKVKSTIWEVRDSNKEVYKVEADRGECGKTGLRFYLDKELVAWFLDWTNYRKIK